MLIMKKTGNLLFLILFCLCSCSKMKVDDANISIASPQPTEQIEQVSLTAAQRSYVDAGNRMAFKFLNQVFLDENIVVSPLSLQYAMAMAANGASSETLQEIVNFLGYGSDGIDALNEYGEAAKLVTGNISGLENLGLFEVPGSIKTEVKAGDIAEVKLRNGKITELSVVYSAGRARTYKDLVDDWTVHNGGTEVWGDVVAVDAERAMVLVKCQTETIPIHIQSNAEIEIFDENERQWIIGSLSDIFEGNYVRITMGNNQVNSVVVFQ